MPTIYTERPHRFEWAALILILALAVFMRLRDPDIVEYKRDEASLSKLVLDIVHFRDFPLLGIDSSVGIKNAPWNVYLMIPPYLFGNNPILATSYVGMLNVIAVLLVYLLVRRYYGPTAATPASFLYAVSLWAVLYSRKIWAQDLFPPFVLMTIGTALLGFWEGKRWAQLLHLPLLAITGQIHYGAVVLIPITLYLFALNMIKQRRLTWAFAISIVLTVLVFVPFAIGAAREGMFSPDVVNKFGSPPVKDQGVQFTPKALDYTLTTIAGTRPEWYFLSEQQTTTLHPEFLSMVPDFSPLLNLIAVGAVLSTLWLLIKVFKRHNPHRVIDITLLLWLLLTPLVFSFTWTAVYLHYMIIMLPAAYSVLGVGIADLLAVLNKRVVLQRVAMAATAVILILAAGAQLWMEHTALAFVDKQAAPAPGFGFGMPLSYYMPVRDSIFAEKPERVLAHLDGQYIILNEEATVWDALLYDLPQVRFQDEYTDVYPAESELFLSRNCTGEGNIFAVRDGKLCYVVGKRDARQLDLTSYQKMNDSALIFANGAQFTHYRWDHDAGCLSLVWTVNGQTIKEDFQIAVQFLNDRKEMITNADALSWQGRYWHKGDTVVRRFCLQDKSRVGDIAAVRIGMYLYEKVVDETKIYPQDLYNPSIGTPEGQMMEIDFKS